MTRASYTDIQSFRFADGTDVYAMEYAGTDGTARWQFASADGSVITGEYLSFRWGGDYLAGVKNADGSAFDLFDPSLRLCDGEQTQPASGGAAEPAEKPAEEGWEYLRGEVFHSKVNGVTTLWNRATGKKLAIPEANTRYPIYTLGSDGDDPVLMVCLKDGSYAVVKGDLELIIPEIGGPMLWVTGPEGEGRLVTGSGSVRTMYAADCRTVIAQWTGFSGFYEDRILTFGSFGCIVMDYSGNVLFCAPGGLTSGD